MSTMRTTDNNSTALDPKLLKWIDQLAALISDEEKQDPRLTKVSLEQFKSIDIGDKGFAIHYLEQHSTFSCIKLNGDTLSGYYLTLSYKYKREKEIYLCDSSLINELISLMRETQRGVENYTLKRTIKSIPLAPAAVWDMPNWESMPIGPSANRLAPFTAGTLYDRYTDPVVIKHFKHHAQEIQKSLQAGELLRILDIGAGTGRLAKKILRVAKELNIPVNYIFAEPSRQQIDRVMQSIQVSELPAGSKIQYVAKTFESVIIKTKVHIAFSSGGPFNLQLATRDQAIRNLEKLQSHLVDNGICILVGTTATAIKSKHITAQQFKILDYSTKHEYPTGVVPTLAEKQAELAFMAFGRINSYVCQKLPISELQHALASKKEEILHHIHEGHIVDDFHIQAREFAVDIIMNPHDAMNFASILELPTDWHLRVAYLREFKRFFVRECGAKLSIDLAPCYFSEAREAGFNDKELKNVKCIDSETMLNAIGAMRNKAKVQAWLTQLDAPNSNITFQRVTSNLIDEEKSLANELFLFKLANAPFVTAPKLAQGLYSPSAEARKARNIHVREFMIKMNGEIVATLMLALHNQNKRVYAADYIVRLDMQDKSLGQAIIVKSADHMHLEFQNSITSSWLISGGDGETAKGEHLYSNVIPLQPVTFATQQRLGLFVEFGNPGAITLAAANRGANKLTQDSVMQNAMKESDDGSLSKSDLVAKYTRLFGTQLAQDQVVIPSSSVQINKIIGG